MTSPPPPAAGLRLNWSNVPRRVRSAIEDRLGSAVVFAGTQTGGFSPGMAAKLATVDGQRLFVKAVGPELNPDSPGIYRREARIVTSLPADISVPRLLWTWDEGDDGWIVLAFEEVEGQNPTQPWRLEELDRVLDALAVLCVALTPSPIDVYSAREYFQEAFYGWQFLRLRPPPELDPWSARHLDALASLEAAAPEVVSGSTLLHMDLRADNILLAHDRVFVVDWPSACVGAPWVDLVVFAPSVCMQGGPEPEELLARHAVVRTADPSGVTAAVAAIAGYLTQRALQPPPPGLPTLRRFQAAQGEIARKWLAERTGWA